MIFFDSKYTKKYILRIIEINLIALFTDVTANKNTTILLTNK